jgi:hypothetical protein
MLVRLSVAGVTAGLVAAAMSASAVGGRTCAAHVGGSYLIVLGHVRAAGPARRLRTDAIRIGFKNATVDQLAPGSYDVDVYGFASRHSAAATAAEAEKARFTAVIQPNQAESCTDVGGDWELVFGHTRTLAAARRLAALVRAHGLGKAQIESDDIANYEVSVDGIQTTSVFAARQRAAERVVPVASFEPS